MAARKKKSAPALLTEDQIRQDREEYDAAYVIMCQCSELKRYRETLAKLPIRREMAGANWQQECPWVGLPIEMSEQDVIDATVRLESETTHERREWMISIMKKHMPYFDPSIYQLSRSDDSHKSSNGRTMRPGVDAVLRNAFADEMRETAGKLLPSEAAGKVGRLYGFTAVDVLLAVSREQPNQKST